MTDLSQELQQLVQAGRLASRPTEGDAERVFAGLEARLGIAAGVAAGAMAASIARDGYRVLAAKIASVTATSVALIAGGMLVVQSLSRENAPQAEGAANLTHSVVLAPSVEAPAPKPSQTLPATTPAAESQPRTEATSLSARGSSRPRDSLSEEVAILTRAERELHSGRAESALRLLSEHERKYRNGKLAEERTAARIQALCALGRVTEANALMTRLSPESLHGEPARRACAAQKKAPGQ